MVKDQFLFRNSVHIRNLFLLSGEIFKKADVSVCSQFDLIVNLGQVIAILKRSHFFHSLGMLFAPLVFWIFKIITSVPDTHHKMSSVVHINALLTFYDLLCLII